MDLSLKIRNLFPGVQVADIPFKERTIHPKLAIAVVLSHQANHQSV